MKSGRVRAKEIAYGLTIPDIDRMVRVTGYCGQSGDHRSRRSRRPEKLRPHVVIEPVNFPTGRAQVPRALRTDQPARSGYESFHPTVIVASVPKEKAR